MSAALSTSATVIPRSRNATGAPMPPREFVDAQRSVVLCQAPGRCDAWPPARRGVVRKYVRQHDGVGGRMRQIEAATERMAQLVVQGHAHGAQYAPGQPRAVKHLAPRLDVAAIRMHARQALRDRGNRFLRDQARDRIRIAGIQPSAACAKALIALVIDISTGSVKVNSGS